MSCRMHLYAFYIYTPAIVNDNRWVHDAKKGVEASAPTPWSALQDGLFGDLGGRGVSRACRLLGRGCTLLGCLLELLHPLSLIHI